MNFSSRWCVRKSLAVGFLFSEMLKRTEPHQIAGSLMDGAVSASFFMGGEEKGSQQGARALLPRRAPLPRGQTPARVPACGGPFGGGERKARGKA